MPVNQEASLLEYEGFSTVGSCRIHNYHLLKNSIPTQSSSCNNEDSFGIYVPSPSFRDRKMERRFTCKYCTQTIYVPPSAQQICCFGCKAVFSVGDSNVVRYKGMPPSAQHINCFGWEIDYSGGNNYGQTYRETEDISCWKKLPFSNEQQSQIGMPPRAVSMTDLPRRGRRALLCGVSYKKQKHELKGTLQDVKNINQLLLDYYDFPTESILILAEEEAYFPPTRKNIENAFRWLVRAIQPGDSLVFYFSGHGTRLQNLN